MFRTLPGFLFLSFLQLSLLPLLLILHSTKAQLFHYADHSSKWTNTPDFPQTVSYPDGSLIKVFLLKNTSVVYGPSFACGFYCFTGTTTTCDSNYFFAIYIIHVNINEDEKISSYSNRLPQVVWSANRNRPIKENATLELTIDGDLILKDADGSRVWSTGTFGHSVARMNLTENGNLMLVDENGKMVWQSFDHPTDTMLPTQTLMEGQKLTASTSTTNFTEGQYYLSATYRGWNAYIDSTPPQLYYYYSPSVLKAASANFFLSQDKENKVSFNISLPQITSVLYTKLEFNGHLRVYGWDERGEWRMVLDLMDEYGEGKMDFCSYPTACGNYGICEGTQCSCPQNNSGTVDYFRSWEHNLGCAQITPISCQASQDHRLLILPNVSYFNFVEYSAINRNLTTQRSCKTACLHNCSCKAAFFKYGSNASNGDCLLISQVFSMMDVKSDSVNNTSTAYIKVQISSVLDSPPKDSSAVDAPLGSSHNPESKSIPTIMIVSSCIGALLGLSLIIGAVMILTKRRKRYDDEEEDGNEDHVHQLPGMITRFSYEELKVATSNFFKKLGEGGFGSVFEGTLTDGTRIAVKRLDNVGQGKKEFLSEVETIGNIHHINLVRLVGFCTWKSQKLLVYEYMSNGSLDQWIFKKGKNTETQLDWKTKCKIINHVAKGLLYLHEECRQRIAHLDIKPQNILLDQNFDAKVSDFGLSKLIDRDQSSVMTIMRGTPGYLAPEWLTSLITEKVDIYSFGVVIVEVVCGRKNLDHSLPEESHHLLKILMQKAEKGKISEFVKDYSCQSKEVDQKEAEKMLRLAIWCLQVDTNKRPSMSSVVKVLEGSLDVDSCLNYNMWTITRERELKSISACSNQSAPLGVSTMPR